jgi:ATP-dependent Lon protease
MEIEIGRVKSINAVKLATGADKKIIVVSQKDPQVEDPKFDDIYKVGTLCTITFMEKNTDDSYRITVKGSKRVKILNFYDKDDLITVDFELLKETSTLNSKDINEKLNLLYDMIEKNYADPSAPKKLKEFKLLTSHASITPSKITDYIAAALPIDQTSKQSILEELDIAKRIDNIIRFSAREDDAKAIDNEITRKVNSSLSKQQKEFYLREKMRVVKEELGEINSRENDVNSFKKRVEENPYPEHIKKRVISELNRMESSNPQENSITRSYVEWLLDLP